MNRMNIIEDDDIMINIYDYLSFKDIFLYLTLINKTKEINFKDHVKKIINMEEFIIIHSIYGFNPRVLSLHEVQIKKELIKIRFYCHFKKTKIDYFFYFLWELKNFFKFRIKQTRLLKYENKLYIDLGYVDPWWKKVDYCIGEKIDVLDNLGIWYEGIIVEYKKDKMIKVHYRQWNETFDQIFYFNGNNDDNFIFHIAPAYTFVSKWRNQIRDRDILEYRDNELWYQGQVYLTKKYLCPNHINKSCDCFSLIKSSNKMLSFYHHQDDLIAPLGVHSRNPSYFNKNFIFNKIYDKGSVQLFIELMSLKNNNYNIRFVLKPCL